MRKEKRRRCRPYNLDGNLFVSPLVLEDLATSPRPNDFPQPLQVHVDGLIVWDFTLRVTLLVLWVVAVLLSRVVGVLDFIPLLVLWVVAVLLSMLVGVLDFTLRL